MKPTSLNTVAVKLEKLDFYYLQKFEGNLDYQGHYPIKTTACFLA